MFVRYLLYATIILCCTQSDSLYGMKMTLATKLQCPTNDSYMLVEAIKEDNAEAVQAALTQVDPTTLIIVSEMYGMLEPKERTYKLSMLQLAVSFLAKKSVALLLMHPIEVDFADTTVNECLGHGTALMTLCRNLQSSDQDVGHEILKSLLVRGANPNQHDFIGTPLMYRARAGDQLSVQLLLGAKADPHVVITAPRFGSGRIEKHFLLRTLVHDIEDRKEKNEDAEGVAIRMAIIHTMLEEGAIPYLRSLEVIGGNKFQEQSALTVAKDQLLRNLLKSYKIKME